MSDLVGSGDTDFVNVVASGDITVGDDLVVTDDVSIGGNLTLTGQMNGLYKVQEAEVAIGGTAFYGMNGTPVQVVADPGDGYTVLFLGALVFIDHSTTDFDFGAGEDLVFRYTDGSGQIVSQSADSTLLNVSADSLIWVGPVGGVSGTPSAHVLTPSEALVAHILSGDGTAGASTVKMKVFYQVVVTADMVAIA